MLYRESSLEARMRSVGLWPEAKPWKENRRSDDVMRRDIVEIADLLEGRALAGLFYAANNMYLLSLKEDEGRNVL